MYKKLTGQFACKAAFAFREMKFCWKRFCSPKSYFVDPNMVCKVFSRVWISWEICWMSISCMDSKTLEVFSCTVLPVRADWCQWDSGFASPEMRYGTTNYTAPFFLESTKKTLLSLSLNVMERQGTLLTPSATSPSQVFHCHGTKEQLQGSSAPCTHTEEAKN